ncbi:MAG: AMP-binding protein [Actinomycetota bacterium]|nr:AMP-binding protein [Actinomycetota bacterium]
MSGLGYYARVTPDAIAIVSPGTTITFAEFDERQAAVVGALAERDVNTRDRIAVLSSNRISSLEVTIGCLRAGIVPIPVNPLLTAPEVNYILEDSGARVLFTDRPVDAQAIEHSITFGDAYERLLHGAGRALLADHALGRPMHYTSGTTGRPKGVWVDPVTPEEGAMLSRGFRELWQLEADDVHLVCSPLAHSAPHRFALRTLEAGGRVVLQERFDTAETLAAIELFGVTSTFMVPTHLERIFALGRQALGRHDMSSVRLLAHAGAPIRDATKRSALETFPQGSVWEFYGSTEGQATRISTREWLERPGSVGRALPGGAVEIRSEDDATLAPGQTGDVWIKDPADERFSYWGDRAKTETTWRGDFFTVGDIGYLDDDGYLFLTGRKHETIISGGVNVYPAEVEAVLIEHPAVREAMVYGAAHDEWGQEVRALVVGEFGQPLDGELLRSWARERLAGFKCPRLVEIVDELPRTPTGKLKRTDF